MSLFAEWLHLHALDANVVDDVLNLIKGDQLRLDLDGEGSGEAASIETGPLAFENAVASTICPPLSTLLGMETSAIADIVSSIHWEISSHDTKPYTIDHSAGQPSEIRMSWQGSTVDLMCLAHEVAHAVQLQLSAGSFMPPLAREACAFLGELALLDWARKNDPDLSAKLLQVWREENQRYFGDDCDLLRAALADPDAVYVYRMNYPLARAAAVVMWRSGADALLLFKAGSDTMALLPLAHIADLAGQTQSYLPPFSRPDAEHPAVNAYRALGAMALLDIDFWKGESERRIEDYYASLLDHLQKETAFIALDEVRRPVGYATWQKASGDNTVTLTRQAAPFGDHLLLQKAVQRHLEQDRDVLARHERSVRQEQVAW